MGGAQMTTPLGLLPVDSDGMRKLVDALADALAKIDAMDDLMIEAYAKRDKAQKRCEELLAEVERLRG